MKVLTFHQSMSLFDLSTFKSWYLREHSTFVYVGKLKPSLQNDGVVPPEFLTVNQFLKAARAYVRLLAKINAGQRPFEVWSKMEARKFLARRPSGEILDLLAVEAGRWFATPQSLRASDEWTHWNEHFSGADRFSGCWRVAVSELVRYVREEVVMSGGAADEQGS